MRHSIKATSMAVLLSLLVSGALQAQPDPQDGSPLLSPDAPWRLLVFPAGDARVTDAINESMGQGFMPVGLEVEEGESLSVLLVQSESITVGNWAIIDYDDWNALEAEITGGIRDGFVPMDISRFGGSLAVLWMKSDIPIDGWRISTSPNELNERTQTVNKFQGQGFTLWGLSEHEGLMWYLFIRQEGVPPSGVISRFGKDTESIQLGLVEANQNGWLPNALAGTADDTFVGFLR